MRRTAGLLASVATAMLLASVVVLATVVGSARSLAAAERPNIVFVMTDDQMPGTENSMPALEGNITSQGTRFTNMISAFPLCCPGRAIILRGQYAHNTHIYGNSLPSGGWEKFRDQGMQKSTIATWLNDSGYQTGQFGKSLNNYTETTIPPGWDRWYTWNGPKQGWTSVSDQGHERPLDPRQADARTGDAALKFLGDHLGEPEPVFAFVNFGAMHKPYYHAKADDDMFEGVRVPRTPAFNEEDISDKPSLLSDLPSLSDGEVARLDENYADGMRSLMRVDRFIGSASDLLRREDEMDNTYFVFYTDNGDHFGQHRLPHGKLQPYEEDVNFPLIIRGPGIPRGVSNDSLLGNHDIAPTLARIGGASVPDFVDGRNFLPIAQDPNAPWPRTAVLSERETNGSPPNKWDMLRMTDRVYTRHENGDKEYYDLGADPYQIHNALGASDTTYDAPEAQTQAYYEQRLNALGTCSGRGGSNPCRQAEDAPLLPPPGNSP